MFTDVDKKYFSTTVNACKGRLSQTYLIPRYTHTFSVSTHIPQIKSVHSTVQWNPLRNKVVQIAS